MLEDLSSIPTVGGDNGRSSFGICTHTHACVQTHAINKLFINQNKKKKTRKGIGLQKGEVIGTSR